MVVVVEVEVVVVVVIVVMSNKNNNNNSSDDDDNSNACNHETHIAKYPSHKCFEAVYSRTNRLFNTSIHAAEYCIPM